MSGRAEGRLRGMAAVVLGLVVVAASGCDSNRPTIPRNPIARHNARVEGRQIVEAACAAHGGYAVWKRRMDARFLIGDDWRGLLGNALKPWPESGVHGEFKMLLSHGYGSATIAGKEAPLTLGLGPEGPWAMVGMRPSQERAELTAAATALPYYMLFFQMPFCFLEYGAVHHYVGVRPNPPGGPVHEVLITFPWYEGERAQDWYIARFDTASMHLRSVTYTATKWGPSLVEYTDTMSGLTEVDSVFVPTRHSVSMVRPFRPGVHRWTIQDLQFNNGYTDSVFFGPEGYVRVNPETS